jgi:two-component system, NtrC family, sensor kinase
MTEARPIVLLVDDEEFILRALKRVLKSPDWELVTAADAEQGLALFQQHKPAVVVSDYRMPGMNGIDLLSEILKVAPDTQRILLTGDADHRALEEAINRSAVFRFVSKPWSDLALLATVKSAFEHHAAAREAARLLQLTTAQNEELKQLNQALDAKVAARTQALSLAKREWELTFDTIDKPVSLLDVQTHEVTRANIAYTRLARRDVKELGAHPKCHQFLFQRDTPCPNCPLKQAGEEQGLTHEVQHGVKSYAVTARRVQNSDRAVVFYRETTEEKALTRSQIETEKMVSVGTLAGGVAHEINNPLGGILAFAQLMKRDDGRSAGDLESLGLIEESALRCKQIVESLLKFARKSRIDERKPFDLSACVEDAVGLFKMQLKHKKGVKLEVAAPKGLPRIDGDAGQLAQVLLNLMQNSAQALPESGGEISISTGTEGQSTWVKVRDTGSGIAKETLPLIFEPYFTTKPPGVGTGLGLAISQRIVRDHGGRLEVATEVGKGCTFTAYFPSIT